MAEVVLGPYEFDVEGLMGSGTSATLRLGHTTGTHLEEVWMSFFSPTTPGTPTLQFKLYHPRQIPVTLAVFSFTVREYERLVKLPANPIGTLEYGEPLYADVELVSGAVTGVGALSLTILASQKGVPGAA